MTGKQGDFIKNFSSLNLKREEKEFLNQKLKEADKDFLKFLKEIFSSFQQNITKDKTFLNFVLQEVEVSSRLLFETSNSIKKEVDPWKKRERTQVLSNEIRNLNSIINDLRDIAQLQFETIELHPKNTNITNLITEQISKHVKNSNGPRILPNFPLESVFFVVDEKRFKILIKDILNLSESLLEKRGTILMEISDSKKELVISTVTHPVKIETKDNLSTFEFLNEKSKTLNTNISKIFAYRIQTITNLLGGDIHIEEKSSESLQISLLF